MKCTTEAFKAGILQLMGHMYHQTIQRTGNLITLDPREVFGAYMPQLLVCQRRLRLCQSNQQTIFERASG